MPKQKAIAIVSGGLDSVTLAYLMASKSFELEVEVDLVSFNYGQRHSKELKYAALCARGLGLRHDIVDLTGLTHLISNSALTSNKVDVKAKEFIRDSAALTVRLTDQVVYVGEDRQPVPIEVPEGHYAEDNMKQTVVPNRNMIMLSIAAGIAVNRGAVMVAAAMHGGDHFIYPDCRPGFIAAANAAIVLGNGGFGAIPETPDDAVPAQFIYVPFLHATKADIAYQALQLGVPLHMTWSCYKGGEKHCGRCGTCVERLEAINEAQQRIAENPPKDWDSPYKMEDHTVYDDDEFWKTAVHEAKEKSNG